MSASTEHTVYKNELNDMVSVYRANNPDFIEFTGICIQSLSQMIFDDGTTSPWFISPRRLMDMFTDGQINQQYIVMVNNKPMVFESKDGWTVAPISYLED